MHPGPLGFWVLTRYEDCVAVLRDQRFGRAGVLRASSSRCMAALQVQRLPRSMLFQDPPDHTRGCARW